MGSESSKVLKRKGESLENSKKEFATQQILTCQSGNFCVFNILRIKNC